MTILIVLLGLALSHLLYPLIRWRSFAWFDRLMRAARDRWPQSDWTPAVVVVAMAVLLALAAGVLTEAVFGTPGWFVLALAAVVYTLGPRDLDRDVQALLAGSNEPRHLKARRVMRIQRDADSRAAAAGVFHAAQARWFGILFWFVALGIAGALLYRLTRLSLHVPDLSPGQTRLLVRLRTVLDWPVLVLMLLSAALAGDLDQVRAVWRDHVRHRPAWAIRHEVLEQVAALSVDLVVSFEDGVLAGHHMVRRMLLIWLVMLSLLLIAGWLS